MIADKDKPAASPLEALAATAETTLAPAPGAPGEDATGDGTELAQTPAVSNEEILSGAIAAARDVFCMYTQLQSPARTLDQVAITNLVKPWCLVLQKRGIDLGRYMGDYGLELAAVIATIGVGRAVVAGVQAELGTTRTSTTTVDAPDSRDPAAVE